MLAVKQVTLLVLLFLTFFPPFLQCWKFQDVSENPIRIFRASEGTTKYMDKQWEADYDANHKWGNQRYTLTLYMPGYPRLHGMIVSHHNGLVTAFPDIEVKCPSRKLFKPCPRSKHTRTVFHGQLRPVSIYFLAVTYPPFAYLLVVRASAFASNKYSMPPSTAISA